MFARIAFAIALIGSTITAANAQIRIGLTTQNDDLVVAALLSHTGGPAVLAPLSE